MTLHILETEADERVRYFASLLLKDKFKFDFDQIESSSVEAIYQRIVGVLVKFPNTTTIVLNNLCLSLVYIYLQCCQTKGRAIEFFKNSVGSI